MDNNVRIIRLGDVNAPNEPYSFEDAFGEYSEASGGGSTKRKQRKLERISNKNEVKLARQSARGERQQGRISKRTDAQATRQAKHTQAEELRAERKGSRKQHRVDRKAIGQEKDEAGAQEKGLDTGVTPEMGSTNGETSKPSDTQSQEGQDTSSQDQPTQGQGSQDQPSGDAPTGGADNSGSYDANYGNSEQSQDYVSEDTTGQEGDYSDEGDYTGGGDYLGDNNDSESQFDGVMGAEDRFSEFTASSIDPSVQDTVNRLVWNKELVNRLENQRNSIGGGDAKQSISKHIILRKKRANELQSQLDGYCNCEGDYSNADGKVVANKRRAEVAHAHKVARQRKRKVQLTPISRDLKADISKNRIVIDSNSSATGTGINALDLQSDFDAPNAREIKLGADGSGGSSISWTSVAIGIAVGAVAIWAVRKYKLIK